jgi:uncharacterized membrane protein
MIALCSIGRVRVNVLEVAGFAASVATVATAILTIIDRRRARRDRKQGRPPEPLVPTVAEREQLTMLEAAPSAWGQPVPALDTGKALTDLICIAAYLFGLLAALPLLFVRRRVVRYHALQSLGIDLLTVGYLVAGTVLGVTWAFIRYGADPIPADDPVLTAFVAGIFVVEILPRLFCMVQILRERPARVPFVWRMAATIAGRAPRP